MHFERMVKWQKDKLVSWLQNIEKNVWFKCDSKISGVLSLSLSHLMMLVHGLYCDFRWVYLSDCCRANRLEWFHSRDHFLCHNLNYCCVLGACRSFHNCCRRRVDVPISHYFYRVMRVSICSTIRANWFRAQYLDRIKRCCFDVAVAVAAVDRLELCVKARVTYFRTEHLKVYSFS